MNEVREKLISYITRMNEATTSAERSLLYREMMTYHYFLPDAERAATDDLMRPYWAEIEKIQLHPDPLLQRAEELLSRIRSRVPQS